MFVNFEGISNLDIRKIFEFGEKEKANASRLLTSAVDGYPSSYGMYQIE